MNDIGAPPTDYGLRQLNPSRLAAIEAHAGPEILDVGCGSGAYVLHLRHRYRIRGVDRTPFDAWLECPTLFNLSDAHSLDLPDASVDTVLSFETLEHLQEPRRALEEYLRVCRRNLILTVPNCEITPGMRASGLAHYHWVDRSHKNFWLPADIEALIRSVGFKVAHRTLINQIDMGPLLAESLGFGRWGVRVLSLIHGGLGQRAYPMTTLVVASKAA